MIHSRWFALLAFVVLGATSLSAQSNDHLGYQGTMSLNGTWNTAINGAANPFPSSGLRLGEPRFGGRAARCSEPDLCFGVGVASWQYNFFSFENSPDVAAVGDGVNLMVYAQYYPVRGTGVFVRGGPGYVRTWSYVGAGNVIEGFKGDRLTLNGGLGVDLPVRNHLALTVSLDYTRVVAATNFAEAHTALIVGAGLTIR